MQFLRNVPKLMIYKACALIAFSGLATFPLWATIGCNLHPAADAIGYATIAITLSSFATSPVIRTKKVVSLDSTFFYPLRKQWYIITARSVVYIIATFVWRISSRASVYKNLSQ